MSTTKVTDSLRNVTAVDAAKLTGAVDVARLPSTVVNSNVDLTTLSASNLTSGTVATARLGSGTASSSTFLRGDSTYAEAGGGAWTKLNSATASDVASLTLTGLDMSTYDTHVILFSRFKPVTSGSLLKMRVGVSDSRASNPGIKTTSDYHWYVDQQNTNQTSHSANAGDGVDYAKIAHDAVKHASGYGGCGGTLFVTNTDTVDQHIMWYGNVVSDIGGGAKGGNVLGYFGGDEGNGSEIDRIQLYFLSGNILSGRVSVFGIKHT